MQKSLEWLKNRYVQLVLALLAGITIGVVFYPSSKIEEKITKELETKYSSTIQELKDTHQKEVSYLQQTLTEQSTEYRSYRETTQGKIDKLVTENSTLKQSIKKKKFKLVKPDGTIIEQEYEESDIDSTTTTVTQIQAEFIKKTEEIENKWKTIHEERVQKLQKDYDEKVTTLKQEQKVEIEKIKSEKTVETNAKKFGLEVGVTTDKEGYVHPSYDIWGPFFLGGQVNGTKSGVTSGEVGLGLRL